MPGGTVLTEVVYVLWVYDCLIVLDSVIVVDSVRELGGAVPGGTVPGGNVLTDGV